MTELIFIIATLIALLFFYYGTGKRIGVAVFSLLWVVFVGILSYNDFFKITDTIPPRFVIVFAGSLIFVMFSIRKIKSVVVDTRLLLLIHVLRLPVEIGLYHLFLEKKVPQIMTFNGWNYDVFFGISAILLFLFSLKKERIIYSKVFLWWNFAGILSVSAILLMGIFSAPLPIQQLSFEQPNIAVLEFPYTYLPAVIVPLVFLSHLLIIKRVIKN